jgi:signal transduction histidine kinase/ActR/RegA family two-component response regulator
MTPTAAWGSRVPTDVERRLFYILPCIYAVLVLAVLPWARVPGVQNPAIATVSGLGVLFADLCTAVLLASEYRRTGRPALVYLAAAFCYSGVMAVLHVLTFPDAVVDGPVIGNVHTVGLLFPFWRLGMLMLLLTAIVYAGAPAVAGSGHGRTRTLAIAMSLVTCVALLMAALFSVVEWPNMQGNSFGVFNVWISWLNVALAIAGAALIWNRRAFDDALYLWLALVLVASAAELKLSVASGARYNVGWYISRASWVVSNCLLLVLWLTHESSAHMPRSWKRIAEYGTALCILGAALLLHWFMLPWLGASFPFAATFASIAIAVWLGGWGPAVCCAIVGYAVVNVWLLEPAGGFVLANIAHALAVALYCFTSAVIIGLGEAMRRARDKHRASEQRLMRSTTALQQADTNKSNFLAVLSHELRNPMAPLRNALTLLGMSPERQTFERVVPIMNRQLAHLSRLVDDLLDVSRIDRGKLELKIERIAMDAVLKEAIETAKPNIEAKSHEFVVRFPADPVYVNGDMVRLTQLVANLLNNAAKFTSPRGHIELALGAEEDYAIVEVADNGIGVAPEELPKIFDMFVQLDASRSVAAGGLGLGLTLARSIAEIHSGTLEVHSAGLNRGTQFVLRLPVARQIVAGEPPRIGARGNLRRRRVLVVDDNHDAATTLAEILRVQGHEVRVAFDGLDGLREAREFGPAVAFIDLNMPRMDGFELARNLRQDPRTCAMTLVAVTGMGQDADVARTRDAGFSAHLSKPAAEEDIERWASGEEAVAASITGQRHGHSARAL